MDPKGAIYTGDKSSKGLPRAARDGVLLGFQQAKQGSVNSMRKNGGE